jgi:predicted transposase/invertase (TIGR01784 family)
MINEIIACEEGIAMASEVLITISKDEREQAWLRSREKYILDTKSNPDYAKQVGHVEGRAEGLAEGMAQGSIRIAHNLKKMGLPVSQIAEGTELPLETIQKL